MRQTCKAVYQRLPVRAKERGHFHKKRHDVLRTLLVRFLEEQSGLRQHLCFCTSSGASICTFVVVGYLGAQGLTTFDETLKRFYWQLCQQVVAYEFDAIKRSSHLMCMYAYLHTHRHRHTDTHTHTDI